mgnify:FL=1
MSGKNNKSALEIYIGLSSKYPDRLKFGALNKDNAQEIRAICESQFGYYHMAAHPFTPVNTVFFESEEDATLAKLALGGDYQFKEFK